MEHKIRRAMAEGEKGRRLRGLVEVDEGYVGGAEKGRGRGGRGHKASPWSQLPSNIGAQGK